VSAAVLVVTSAAVALVCIPPGDFGDLTPGLGNSSRFGSGVAIRVASSATAVWRALVPIPASVGEWNANLLDHQPGAVWVEAVLSIALFAVVLVALRERPFARRLWWVGNLGLFAFFLIVTRPEALRHAGFAFLLFVACVWFAAAPPLDERQVVRTGRDGSIIGTVVVVVLAAQILATLAVYPSASFEDFSRDAKLAQAVHDARLDGDIVSAQDWDATTIGGYLDRDVYSLARREEIHYMTTDRRQERGMAALNSQSVACAAQRRANHVGRPLALVVAGDVRGFAQLVREDGATVYRVAPGPLPARCA
jgi:NADH:ubiquinone oxidoreductase subunit 6 (subunit J)